MGSNNKLLTLETIGDFQELLDDPRGRPPDIPAIVMKVIDRIAARGILRALLNLEAGLVQKIGNRHGEDFGRLVAVDDKRVGMRDDADEGGDQKTIRRSHLIELAQNAHVSRIDPDLFVALSQRRGEGTGIFRIDFSAGKGDLALMM